MSDWDIIRIIWTGVIAGWLLTWFTSRKRIEKKTDKRILVTDFLAATSFSLLLNDIGGMYDRRLVPENAIVHYAGIVITLVGLGFAVWARLTMGRNWSAGLAVMPEGGIYSRGPFAIVAHPIYAGFIWASLGTVMIAMDIKAIVGLCLITLAWGYKAYLEEQFMTAQFGEAYRRYRRQVGGLLPRLFQ